MSHVNVTINGRQYRMACEDGQEDHLRALAESFDRRIGSLRANFGEIGDMRLTVMAALMLADELAEAESRLKAIEQERDGLREHGAATQSAVIAALNAASERIEAVTRGLNQTLGEAALPIG
ncbi:MAG TPA: cell division protein ZapA [Xanthobacteraceae bacterium]|nr:cell division protein ZapA [Xanthobacteraceae bacterium]